MFEVHVCRFSHVIHDEWLVVVQSVIVWGRVFTRRWKETAFVMCDCYLCSVIMEKVFILIRTNKMQQYAGIYLLQNHCTCFWCLSLPSSGVNKTLNAASGTGHSIWVTTFLQHGQIRTNLAMVEEGCCPDTTTCTRGRSYSFMYSWKWVRWTPKTCRVILR
jgi:hypothetical protein